MQRYTCSQGYYAWRIIYLFFHGSSTEDPDQEHIWQQWCHLVEQEL